MYICIYTYISIQDPKQSYAYTRIHKDISKCIQAHTYQHMFTSTHIPKKDFGIQAHTTSILVCVSAAFPPRTHIPTHRRRGGCIYVQVYVSTYWYTCTSTLEGRRLSVSRVTGCGKLGSSPQVTSFSCTLGGNDNRNCVYM